MAHSTTTVAVNICGSVRLGSDSFGFWLEPKTMRAMAALKLLSGEAWIRGARASAMADPLGQTPPDGCGRLGVGVSIGWVGESYGNDIAQIFVRLWRNRGPPIRS